MTDATGENVERQRSDDDREVAERLVEQAREEGLDLVGPDGVLTGLTKQVPETGLEAELTEHLGYDKHATEDQFRRVKGYRELPQLARALEHAVAEQPGTLETHKGTAASA